MFETVTLHGEVQGALLKPARPSGLGVLVITGSSGRVDFDRAGLFAARGCTVLAQRWWGGEGQATGINEIPLEVFVRGVDLLEAEGCTRIAMLGTSRGAEATLSAAARDRRIGTAIAISPTQVLWQNFGPGLDGRDWPPRSAFTWRSAPLPFICFDPRAFPPPDAVRPAYRRLHEESVRIFAEDVPAARIPVEEIEGQVVLVAGAADALWPSDASAQAIAADLLHAGRAAIVVEHPRAGHSPCFPGEPRLPEPKQRAWGGTAEADRELGAAAWARICEALRVPP